MSRTPPFHAASHRGRVRERNEDYVLTPVTQPAVLADKGLVLAVADGVGGAHDGHVASEMAIDLLIQHIVANPSTNPTDLLIAAITEANLAIYREGQRRGKSMATTITAAILRQEGLWIANVGDSRAYLWQRGAIKQLTMDHTELQEAVDNDQLTRAQARQIPRSGAITRALGADAYVNVDTFGPFALQRGSRLLLCTDGLYGEVPDSAFVSVLRRGDLSDITSRLIRMANEAGGRDNITLTIADVEQAVQMIATAVKRTGRERERSSRKAGRAGAGGKRGAERRPASGDAAPGVGGIGATVPVDGGGDVAHRTLENPKNRRAVHLGESAPSEAGIIVGAEGAEGGEGGGTVRYAEGDVPAPKVEQIPVQSMESRDGYGRGKRRNHPRRKRTPWGAIAAVVATGLLLWSAMWFGGRSETRGRHPIGTATLKPTSTPTHETQETAATESKGNGIDPPSALADSPIVAPNPETTFTPPPTTVVLATATPILEPPGRRTNDGSTQALETPLAKVQITSPSGREQVGCIVIRWHPSGDRDAIHVCVGVDCSIEQSKAIFVGAADHGWYPPAPLELWFPQDKLGTEDVYRMQIWRNGGRVSDAVQFRWRDGKPCEVAPPNDNDNR